MMPQLPRFPLSGLGMWIWIMSKCEGGDWKSIADKATKSGINWLAIKAGESHSNKQVTEKLIDYFHERGIEVAAWWYSRPTTTATELTLLKVLQGMGVRHFIMDAEIEWETSGGKPYDWRTKAADFAGQIRESIGESVFLYDAPWAMPNSHPLFPFQEFGAAMDARMPQYYWKLAQREPSAYFKACNAQWAKFETDDERIMPIGCNVDYKGIGHGTIEHFQTFLTTFPHDRSLWSWQHLDVEEWKLLKA